MVISREEVLCSLEKYKTLLNIIVMEYKNLKEYLDSAFSNDMNYQNPIFLKRIEEIHIDIKQKEAELRELNDFIMSNVTNLPTYNLIEFRNLIVKHKDLSEYMIKIVTAKLKLTNPYYV